MHAANGERLASARSWRLAAERSQFSYEQRVMLYRKALIHFAHSESWTEAIELLNREQALQSALTKRTTFSGKPRPLIRRSGSPMLR